MPAWLATGVRGTWLARELSALVTCILAALLTCKMDSRLAARLVVANRPAGHQSGHLPVVAVHFNQFKIVSKVARVVHGLQTSAHAVSGSASVSIAVLFVAAGYLVAGFLVQGQSTQLSKGSTAQVAVEGFLTSVKAHVCLEMGFLLEPLEANITREWPITIQFNRLDRTNARPSASLSPRARGVQLHTAVSPLVHDQLLHRLQLMAANVAVVGFVTLVLALVVVPRLGQLEAQVAQPARVGQLQEVSHVAVLRQELHGDEARTTLAAPEVAVPRWVCVSPPWFIRCRSFHFALFVFLLSGTEIEDFVWEDGALPLLCSVMKDK